MSSNETIRTDGADERGMEELSFSDLHMGDSVTFTTTDQNGKERSYRVDISLQYEDATHGYLVLPSRDRYAPGFRLGAPMRVRIGLDGICADVQRGEERMLHMTDRERGVLRLGGLAVFHGLSPRYRGYAVTSPISKIVHVPAKPLGSPSSDIVPPSES